MKPLRLPPGLVRMEVLTDRKIPAPPISDEQRATVHGLVERAAAGHPVALRFDDLRSTEIFLRHLIHNTPRPLSFVFGRTEIVVRVELEDLNPPLVLGDLHMIAITTKQTGMGRETLRIRKLGAMSLSTPTPPQEQTHV